MTADLQLEGPTVTLFGIRDELDQALGVELARRGCSTHIITASMGWLASTTHAVIRLGTPTGDQAMHGLAASSAPATHAVAVCETTSDAAAADRIRTAWAQSSENHRTSLIWHDSLDALHTSLDRTSLDELVSTIADEIFEPTGLEAP